MSRANLRLLIFAFGSLPLLACFQNCTKNFELISKEQATLSSASNAPGQIIPDPNIVDQGQGLIDRDGDGEVDIPSSNSGTNSNSNSNSGANTDMDSDTQVDTDTDMDSDHNSVGDSKPDVSVGIGTSSPSDSNHGGGNVDDASALGFCHLATNQRGSRIVGYTNVTDADFERENQEAARVRKQAQDQGEFLAPHHGASQVCMSQNACLGIINDYLAKTDGVLLARPVHHDAGDGDFAKFQANKGFCKRADANVFSDARVASELEKLKAYWAAH